ncbi:MAG: hypothetical protein RJA70_184 [Pseudomonadota bacterium]|jgi:O-succinylbenzoic acid--CoA ligase
MSDAFDLWPWGDADPPLIIASDGQPWSRAQLSGQVTAVIHSLVAQGVKPAQRTPVPFIADNTLRSLCRLLALLQLRVPALLLHPAWTDAERDLRLSEAGLVPFAWPALEPQPGPHPRPPPVQVAASHPLAVVYSSGSSAQPKAIVLSRGAFESSVLASSNNFPWQPNDRWQLSLPLAHVGGLSVLLRCLHARRTLVLTDRASSAQAEVQQLGERAITHVSVVPTQLKRWLDTGLRCPPTLRAVLLGGAPSPASLVNRARERGFPILKTYGLTEYASQVATQSRATPPPPTTTTHSPSGRPLGHVELRITEGVLWLRGPSLFSGTFARGAYTPAALDADGWFCTQDSAEFDANGELCILGRRDEVLITGGENVQPEEVESALVSLSDVHAACVFGLPDDEWGTRICAAVVSPRSEASISAELVPILSGYKRPKQIFRVSALPCTSSGKVSRRLTAELCRTL